MSVNTSLPAVPFFDTANRPNLGPAYEAWEAMLAVLTTLGLLQAPDVIALDGGQLALTGNAMVQLLPPDVDSSGELEQIGLGSVADGRLIMLGVSDAARPITVKHLKSGITDDGELVLSGAADLVLANTGEFLWLQRRGAQFYQVAPLGSARITQLYQDLNLAGFGAYGHRYLEVLLPNSTATITTAHIGRQCVNAVSCVVTLPNAQPALPAKQWAVGDVIWFRQIGASLSFVKAGGGTVQHALNHDRGYGPGAKMEVQLIGLAPFTWLLNGFTTAPSVGGTINRTALWSSSLSTIVTDAASTAWKNAQSLAHTPGSSETWIYFANFAFKSNGNQAVALGQARLQRSGTGPAIGSSRYSTNQEAPCLIHAVAYGASPGAQQIDLDVMSGNAANASSIIAPAIIGLKLESGEFAQLAAGSASNVNSTSYLDLVTMTQTLAAEDYYAIAFGQLESANTGGLTVCLDIDGSAKQEKVMSRNTGMAGYYCVIQPFTASAGSHTLKLRGKSNGAWNSTVSQMGIVLLKKSAFQEAFSANDATDTSTAATGYQDKVTGSFALTPGWYYLAIGDQDLKISDESASAAAKGQLTMNGNRIGAEAQSMVRDAATWTPIGQMAAAIVQKVLASDAFAVQYCSKRSNETVNSKDASIVILALKPV